LYGWTTAVWVCPGGWHLPSDHEWKILEGTVDSRYPVGDTEWDKGGYGQYRGYRGFDAGENLKSVFGWPYNGNRTDLYGFGALPSGGRQPDDWKGTGSFYGLGHDSRWWSSSESSEYSDAYAWSRHLYIDNDGSYRIARLKTAGFSVRCVKDPSAISADFMQFQCPACR
ncbi:MAG: hypothetical protein GY746_16145, partial [Gammaproteobacteria bacterium]|nr:hypothetical protein [Gammaproteobacteria bacterium]